MNPNILQSLCQPQVSGIKNIERAVIKVQIVPTLERKAVNVERYERNHAHVR